MTMMKEEIKLSKVKVFQCTGFGNCCMVFTRNEHLVRHKRKHIGEKPFQCIVSGCKRMFSRYDNMLQHTHTHNKLRKPRTKKTDSLQPLSIQSDLRSDQDKCSRIWTVL